MQQRNLVPGRQRLAVDLLRGQMHAVVQEQYVRGFGIAMTDQQVGVMTAAPCLHAQIEPLAAKGTAQWPAPEANQFAIALGHQRLVGAFGQQGHPVARLSQQRRL